jgi:serine/threonine protein kinase
MADILKKFGRFFLLDQIAQGGMAEIYRARLASIDGAGRLIVIKRIQAGFGGNTEFLQMFRSEIKVTMGFNHPNIVQLYDFGEEAGQPYIAMELVDGKNLRQFMNRFSEMKQTFPPALAAHIVEQSASALHYAHAFKDKITGEHLSIVHRDISPQNILISFEGTVKVIDFGIAKATTNLESTRAGVIKGKPSYLSPEQIAGEMVDGRSDIFALGIVLWELLVGRKLFSGDNELAVLKQIESCQTHIKPPSHFVGAIPPDLDAIVMKTLSKQRDKRYQNAEELQRALHRFIYATYPDFNPTDLSYCARDMFKTEIVEDRKRLQRLNEEVEKKLIASELVVHHEAKVFEEQESTPNSRSKTPVDKKKAQPANHQDAKKVAEYEAPKNPSVVRFEDSKKVMVRPKTPAEKKPVVQPVVPGAPSSSAPRENLVAAVASEPSKKTRIKRAIPVLRIAPSLRHLNAIKSFSAGLAAVLILSFVGPSFGISVPVLSHFLRENGRNPDAISQPIVAVDGNLNNISAQDLVTLILDVQPPGKAGVVRVNGVAINSAGAKKLPGVRVAANSRVEIDIDNPDQAFRKIHREFVIDSTQVNAEHETTNIIKLEPAQSGYLTIKTSPTADAVIFDSSGKQVWKGTTASFEKKNFPVGLYTVRLTNELLDMKKELSVEIKDGETTAPYNDEVTREIKLAPVNH